MTTAIWELTAIKIGRDRAARVTFYVDEVEAATAAQMANEHGYATRLQPIAMPTDPKRFADLLTDFVARYTVGGAR